MPTTRYFEWVPSFPDNVPLAPLSKTSLEKLQHADSKDSLSLYQSACQWGFFLVNLEGSVEGQALLHYAESMFDLNTATFSLNEETLQKHAFNPPHDLTGYKRRGMLRTDDGKMDRMQLYSINQDEMVGNRPRRSNLSPIEANRAAVRKFIEYSHAVAEIILRQLDCQLGLDPETLNSLGPLEEESETSVRLLLAQPQSIEQGDVITLGGHTDIGTITLLFNVVGGLQILPAGREHSPENWLYVRPEPGCVIVNIGDTLVEWTAGVLRSSLHRVVAPPGEQNLSPRHSVAYLLRPRASASMRRLVGGKIPVVQGEEEDPRVERVNEWAASRAKQIILGQLKPETRGGCGVDFNTIKLDA